MSNRCTIKQSKRSRPNIPTATLNLPRKPPKDPQGMTCKISWFHFGGLKSSSSHSHDSLEVFHGAQMPQHQFHIFSGGWLSKSCTRITKHHQTSEMMRGNARAFFYPILKLGARGTVRVWWRCRNSISPMTSTLSSTKAILPAPTLPTALWSPKPPAVCCRPTVPRA